RLHRDRHDGAVACRATTTACTADRAWTPGHARGHRPRCGFFGVSACRVHHGRNTARERWHVHGLKAPASTTPPAYCTSSRPIPMQSALSALTVQALNLEYAPRATRPTKQ